ncbi:hypothetical protein ACWD4F_27000 [Streptomyces aureus]
MRWRLAAGMVGWSIGFAARRSLLMVVRSISMDAPRSCLEVGDHAGRPAGEGTSGYPDGEVVGDAIDAARGGDFVLAA